jgi:hypothetical protein
LPPVLRITTPPGRRPDERPSWPRNETGWKLMAIENMSVAAAFDLSYDDLASGRSCFSGGSRCTRAPSSTALPPPP